MRVQGGDNAVIDFRTNSTATWVQAADKLALGNGYQLCLNPNGGNVGIGTTTPAFTIDVEGIIRASEVKVCLQGGCDFVFKGDYKLMDLNVLEAFIKNNQYLPEIASEKEMIENGVNMKELQMKLLQKIEELTLYTIEQNKKIEQLRKENIELKELKERIDRLEVSLSSICQSVKVEITKN